MSPTVHQKQIGIIVGQSLDYGREVSFRSPERPPRIAHDAGQSRYLDAVNIDSLIIKQVNKRMFVERLLSMA